MKKTSLLLFLTIWFVFLFGCANSDYDDLPTVTGVIREIHDNSILISTSTEEGYPYGASFDISVNISDCEAIDHSLSVGDQVIVYYDGNMEGWDPAQISTVYDVTLKTSADNP